MLKGVGSIPYSFFLMNFDTDDKTITIENKTYPVDPDVFKLVYSLSLYKERTQLGLEYHLNQNNIEVKNVAGIRFLNSII